MLLRSAVMLHPVRDIKRLWHRDIVADPEVHAWALNLYRAGELYPERVDDYFPVAHAPWPWLAEAMGRHHDDERRHGAMFARAIRLSGHAVRDDLAGDDVFNHVIRACTPVPFHIADDDAPGVKRTKLAHFLAHAWHLERRVSRSLEFHLEACESTGSRVVAKVVTVVLGDEVRHTRYTREAIDELVTRREASEIMDVHRRAEARANLLFSRRQVRRFVERFGGRAGLRRRALYTVCAFLQEAVADHV